MLEVFALLAAATLLAGLYSQLSFKPSLTEVDSGGIKLSRQPAYARFSYWVLAILLVCFAGLRTTMNDTGLYIVNFENMQSTFSSIRDVDWEIGANPLFSLWQLLIVKLLPSSNGQVFVFLTALFTVSLSLSFLRKYSQNFGLCVFVFLGLTTYAFMLAAMKQTMATAIAVWAIPKALEKKWAAAVIIIAIAVLIHPYVFILAIAFFLTDNVWDKKTVLILLATVVGLFSLSYIIDIATSVSESVGDDYSTVSIAGEQGVNTFRLLVFAAIPLLSFVCRKNLNSRNCKIMNLSVNCSVVSFCFMLIARFANPIVFGRLAGYYEILTCLAFPYVIRYGITNPKTRKTIVLIAVPCYCFFYWKYYSKYGTSLFADYYQHAHLFELFGG